MSRHHVPPLTVHPHVMLVAVIAVLAWGAGIAVVAPRSQGAERPVARRPDILRCDPVEDALWVRYRDLPLTGHPNALWAQHGWLADFHTPCELRRFARQIRQLGLTDLFLHAGPIRPDGTVAPGRNPRARDLLDALHELVPDVRLQAYLGQVEGTGPEDLDLRDPAKLARTVTTAGEMLDLGFDGIHYDIEPIRGGEPRFVDLFARTRDVAAARGAVVSIAVEERHVDPDSGFPPNVQTASVSDDWLRALAAHVDQLAIMVYDSRRTTDADYERWTAYQARTVAEAVAASDTQVLIGIPTDKRFVSYHTAAENAGTGARGLRRGVDALPPELGRRVGGAIFAEWVSTEEDYRTIEREWVRPEGP